MLMLKAFKYRLYPDKESSILLNKHFGCARWLYNFGFHTKIETYKNSGVSISCIDIANRLPRLKQEFPWLKEVNSQIFIIFCEDIENIILDDSCGPG
jgi:putative transposase